MLKKILIGVVVLLAIFAGVVAMQPSKFSVSRSATLDVPPAAAFEQVNSFKKWQVWSPWSKIDPEATATFSGPESGKGASFAWDGNGDVGAGSMTITDSQPNEKILIDLTFTRPFAGTNLTEFTFKPKGDASNQTEVTWTMSGENNFFSRAVCMFMNMDKMVGEKFEEGLTAMNEAAKKEAK